MVSTRFTEGDGSIVRARSLRRNATVAENALWAVFRASALDGRKFRRQQRFGPFTADFICHSARLVIEVDGDTHAFVTASDGNRTSFIEREGYQVLRFANADVMSNLEGVVHTIRSALSHAPSPSHPAAPGGPLPLPHGERKS